MNELNIVKTYYTHFNNRNWQGMLDIVSDDIAHYPNEGDPRHGKELFTQFLQKMDTAYSEKLTGMIFYTADDPSKIAVQFTVNGIYKIAEDGLPPAHGQPYVLPAAAFLEVSDGKIRSVTTYYNLHEWIEKVS